MEHTSSLIENLVGIFLGTLLILGRLEIEKIFMKNALYHKKTFNRKILMVIIFIIGLGFILGGIFGIFKMLTVK